MKHRVYVEQSEKRAGSAESMEVELAYVLSAVS